jgi:small subunit ribosomal protein S24e
LPYSDVLHPNRANVSKDELRGKLGELYKAKKEDVSVFGFKTHFGGGKSTGFALIYDSAEAMKKFEPRYRLVRYGMATKVEKASRQQRTFLAHLCMLPQTPRGTCRIWYWTWAYKWTGKQRKNRMKEFRGTAKTKGGAKKDKK